MPHVQDVGWQSNRKEQEHEARPGARVLDPVAYGVEEDERASSRVERERNEKLGGGETAHLPSLEALLS